MRSLLRSLAGPCRIAGPGDGCEPQIDRSPENVNVYCETYVEDRPGF